MAAPLDISEDHPLALELTSLRSAVARFQNEAHHSSLKLQHHALSVAQAHERTQYLERENSRLHEEIAVLRAYPHPSESSEDPTALQTTINQLAIALRSVSDKLGATESALLARTTDLAHAVSDLARAKLEVEGAYELAARTRGREEEGLVRERELQARVRAAEEGRKMSDLVVMEYADLVRSLEGRPSVHAPLQENLPMLARSESVSSGNGLPNGSVGTSTSTSTVTLVDSLTEGKNGLQKLLSEFGSESSHLQAEIDRLTHDLTVSLAKYDALTKNAERDRAELAKAKFELEKLRMDDGTAAKMVSRYMKFSQQTANDLQSSLSTLTTRHASTLSTLSSTVQTLQTSLSREKRISEHLRAALDELTADIAREVYGRRREVALRLRLVSRDERLGEGVRRLARRVEEGLTRVIGVEGVGQVFEQLAAEAKVLLNTVDGESDGSFSQGALGRIITAESAVKMLTRELQVETEKRMRLERMVAVAVEDSAGEKRKEPGEEEGALASQDAADEDVPSLAANYDPLTEGPLDRGDGAVHAVGGGCPSESDGNDDLRDIVGDFPRRVNDADEPLDTSSADAGTLPESVGPDFQSVGGDPVSSKGVDIVAEPELSPSDSPASARQLAASPRAMTSQQDLPPPLASPADSRQFLNSSPNLVTPPLLAELTHVCHRYDDLQRAFRDCHIALEGLKMHLKSSASTASPIFAAANMTPVLQTALERLYDYTEDARVELEIRTADEALLARGFETLISVQGALASETSPSLAASGPTNDHLERAEVERDVRAFVDGTDPSVAKALQSFTKKLDDIQHDIAAIKRVVHDPVLESEPLSATDDHPLTPSTPPLPSSGSTKWSSWTAGILGNPSRPVSPSPTFGNVMTTPRLRHTPSLNFYGTSRGRKMSVDLPSGGTGNGSGDPFASLGLRVPMPAHMHVSPTRPSPRPRTLSAMYMLGLGAGSGSLAAVTSRFVANGREDTMDEDGAGAESDSGVE